MPALPEGEEYPSPSISAAQLWACAKKARRKREEFDEWVKEHNKIPAKLAEKRLNKILKKMGVDY